VRDDPSLRPPGRCAHPRAPAALEASYEDAVAQLFLRTADLSLGGVLLIARPLPPLGQAARVLLELPGDPAIHRLAGVVARHQEAPVPGFAVAFDPASLPDATREALQRFVESALTQGRD
jgi:hypothetical protein